MCARLATFTFFFFFRDDSTRNEKAGPEGVQKKKVHLKKHMESLCWQTLHPSKVKSHWRSALVVPRGKVRFDGQTKTAIFIYCTLLNLSESVDVTVNGSKELKARRRSKTT